MTYSWQHPETDRFQGKHATVADAVAEYYNTVYGPIESWQFPARVLIGEVDEPDIETLVHNPEQDLLYGMNASARDNYRCEDDPFDLNAADENSLGGAIRDAVLAWLTKTGRWPPKFWGVVGIKTYTVQSDGSFAEVTL